jgi:hypothetical protein
MQQIKNQHLDELKTLALQLDDLRREKKRIEDRMVECRVVVNTITAIEAIPPKEKPEDPSKDVPEDPTTPEGCEDTPYDL